MAISSIYYILVILGTAIFCLGITFLLKKPFYNLAISATKQLDILLNSSLSEIEKDKRILGNLFDLLKNLLSTFFLLLLVLMCGILLPYLYAASKINYLADTSSISFYGCMLLGSLPLLIFKKKTDYSYWSKLLHTIVLDNYNIGKFLFHREVKNTKIKQEMSEQPFVIVSGLARAGTTALTNLLYDDARFHSIRYANVPFLLAPNLWAKIYRPKAGKKKERAHGDQVLFSEHSIEALEEYFFKVFLNDEYIHADALKMHNVTRELVSKYSCYQDQFRKKENTIYLAKNNNFILRYESFLNHGIPLKLILIFRKPLDHAASLLNQHNRFTKKQKEDDFILKYMDWLGHYEFGLNHKYFSFDGQLSLDSHNKRSINYWLTVWINYYTYVSVRLNTSGLCLVSYEEFLANPEYVKRELETYIGISLSKDAPIKFQPKPNPTNKSMEVNEALLVKADKIYSDLLLKKNS